jgi:hypothetical protein
MVKKGKSRKKVKNTEAKKLDKLARTLAKVNAKWQTEKSPR